MKLNTRKKLVAAIVGLALGATLHAADLERPKVQLVDRFGVNVLTGQVTAVLETVSIGGAMGLSHSVSAFTNNFNFLRYRGFADKYYQRARYVTLSETDPYYTPRNVLRLQDDKDTADFVVVVGGLIQNEFRSMPPPYTYQATGDERHTLVANNTNGDLEWTKPDGTVVKFTRGVGATAGQEGLLYEIDYPSGFIIYVHSGGMAVTTNTGFMLKALYQGDNRDFRSSPPVKVDNPLLKNVGPWYTSDASSWSVINPKYIKAINTTLEYCTPLATTCALTNNWPTATFNWPAGMPRTMFIGDTTMNVVDAEGGVTEYTFRAYDLALDEYGNIVDPYRPNEEMSPRLIGLKPASSNTIRFRYDYINKFSFMSYGESTWNHRATDSGVIKSASDIGKTGGYSMMQPYMGGDYWNDGYGGGVSRVHVQPNSVQGNREKMQYASTDEGMIWYEHSIRNFPERFEKVSGPHESYGYTRGNLSSVSYGINGAWQPHMTAQFPATCTAATRKTCNQAEWVKDGEGKTTYYAYHPQSGQVSSVTHPANKRGLVPQIRYEYTQLSARYFNGGSSKIIGPPIWMKSAEKYCINSSFNGSACTGGDEVVTRYEYNDNLLVKGMTMTDPLTGAVKRTCYKYDIYANQIGVTQPKANLTSCN